MSEISRQVRIVARGLVRRPRFALLVIVTLGLGIGANAALFNVYWVTVERPMPFPDPERLAMVVSTQPAKGIDLGYLSQPDFRDLKERNAVFDGLAAVSNTRSVVLTGGDRPEALRLELVSADYFQVLGVDAVAGGLFDPQEDAAPGGRPVVLLSHELWQRRFAGEPGIVGQKLTLNEIPFTVVGVVDPVYRGAWWEPIDVWLPMSMTPAILGEEFLDGRGRHWNLAVARLGEGATLARAQEDLARIMADLEREMPQTNRGYSARAVRLPELYFDHQRERFVRGVLGAVFVVLLCAANVACLMLTRGMVRARDAAVRSTLGAGRWRIVSQNLVEGGLLALAGGAVGLLLGSAATRWLLTRSDIPPASFDRAAFEPWVAVATLVLSLLIGMAFSLAPVAQALCGDPQAELRAVGTERPPGPGRWVLGSLTLIEVGLAMTVLVVAGLLIQSFLELERGDPGFDADHLVVARVQLPAGNFADPVRAEAFLRQLTGELEALPEVAAAAVLAPGPHAPPFANLYSDVVLEDRLGEPEEGSTLRAYRQCVTPGYLRTLGIELLAGEDIAPHNLVDDLDVAVVSRRFAERAWPGESALGKRLRRGLASGVSPWMTVIGVAADAKSRGIARPDERDLDLYLPLTQEPRPDVALLLRTVDTEVSASAGSLLRVLEGLGPDAPVLEVEPMRERMARQALDDRFEGTVVGVFGAVALLVAVVGLYAVLSFTVRQRRHEIGVRLALGASRGAVRRMVLRQGLAVLGGGVVLGLAGAFLLSRFLPPAVFGIDPMDPLNLLLAAAVLVVVGIVATWVPAREATRIEPILALRCD